MRCPIEDNRRILAIVWSCRQSWATVAEIGFTLSRSRLSARLVYGWAGGHQSYGRHLQRSAALRLALLSSAVWALSPGKYPSNQNPRFSTSRGGATSSINLMVFTQISASGIAPLAPRLIPHIVVAEHQVLSEQTRDIEPLLVQWWPAVYDIEPAIMAQCLAFPGRSIFVSEQTHQITLSGLHLKS